MHAPEDIVYHNVELGHVDPEIEHRLKEGGTGPLHLCAHQLACRCSTLPTLVSAAAGMHIARLASTYSHSAERPLSSWPIACTMSSAGMQAASALLAPVLCHLCTHGQEGLMQVRRAPSHMRKGEQRR